MKNIDFFIKNIKQNRIITNINNLNNFQQQIFEKTKWKEIEDIDINIIDDYEYLIDKNKEINIGDEYFYFSDLFKNQNTFKFIKKMDFYYPNTIKNIYNHGDEIIFSHNNYNYILDYISQIKEYRQEYYNDNLEILKGNLKKIFFSKIELCFFNMQQLKYDLMKINNKNTIIKLKLPPYINKNTTQYELYKEAKKEYNSAIDYVLENTEKNIISLDNISNYNQEIFDNIKEIITNRMDNLKKFIIENNYNNVDCALFTSTLYYDFIKINFPGINLIKVENIVLSDYYNDNTFISYNDIMNNMIKDKSYEYFFIFCETFNELNQDIMGFNCNYHYPMNLTLI